MTTKRFGNIVAGLLIAAVLAVLIAGSFLLPTANVSGAPANAVLTPVSNSNANAGARFAIFFSGTPISADTRACAELGNFDVMDLQYVVTQTGVNTITLKSQYSNNASGADYTGGNFVDANTYLSGTPVPASTPFTAMSQQALFGRYHCIYADVSNATPVSIYASGVAK